MTSPDDGRLKAARGNGFKETLHRYGPLAVMVVLLLIVAVLVVTRGDDGDGGATGEPTGDDPDGAIDWSDASSIGPGAPVPTGQMPPTYAETEAAGDTTGHSWPDACDTGLGRVKLPSAYALPCVPASDEDNGGETARGVSADSVKVVLYMPDATADVSALLNAAGADDTAEQQEATLEAYIDIYASVAEQYGREIEIVPFQASGPADDVVAAHADATDIIAMEPFAVLDGPDLDRGTFAQELAAAGILCMGCSAALPDQVLQDLAPYLWKAQPSNGQILDLLNTWVEALNVEEDAVAELAGGDLRGQTRKLGVIHFDQDPPIFGDTGQQQNGAAADALTESYVFDLTAMPAKATELIAQFEAEGITTIVFLGDPFMPIYLTQAATEQDYHPEWVFTGTALTDTNFFGRQYDSAQMERALGISQLAAPTEQDLQETVRLYRWYVGDSNALPPAENSYGLIAPQAAWLVSGIHMAGPELTPETFARGLFRIPPSGGGPTTPQISFGNWGHFPEIDYSGIDDAVEIWWDPDVTVEDERGVEGQGAWRRSTGGERFTPSDTPATNPFGDPGSALTVVEELTGDEIPPDYPPPAGSPAARS